MMALTLLQQFVSEECTPYVRDLVRGAIEAGQSGTGPRMKHFEFNRFEVTYDLEQGFVLVEDVLDAGEAGAQRIPISEFLMALEKT